MRSTGSLASAETTPRTSSASETSLSENDVSAGHTDHENRRGTPKALERSDSQDLARRTYSEATTNELVSIAELDDTSIIAPRRVPGRSTWSNAPTNSSRLSAASSMWRYSQDSMFHQQLESHQSLPGSVGGFSKRETIWSMARPDSSTLPEFTMLRTPLRPPTQAVGAEGKASQAMPALDASLSPRPATVSPLALQIPWPPAMPQGTKNDERDLVSPQESSIVRSQRSSVGSLSRVESTGSSLASWSMVPAGYTPPQAPPPPSPDTEDELADLSFKTDDMGRLSIGYPGPPKPGWF